MDSDNENEEFQAWKGVPATIVLINAYNPSKSESPARSQVATCRMIRQHLRLASTHYIGVVLYGTDSDTAVFGLQNITEICPLELPNLDDFKKLQKAKLDSYGQAKELRLSDALWHCSKMFTNCKKQLLSRTIIMMTGIGIAPVEADHRATYMRVSNLVESNIDIKLINISKDDCVVSPFYKNFLSEANGGKDVELPKPVWDYNKIENLMFQHSHRHLAIARLNFDIGDGIAIGVGVYSLLKSNTEPKNANLHRDTNAVLTNVTKTLKVSSKSTNHEMEVDPEEEGGEKHLPLLKTELLYYQQYGGERVEFTDKEKKKMDNPFGPPLLKLLGFKPFATMSMKKWFLKPCYFLYPNEDIIEGSTVAFKALHKACLDMSMVAVCVLCTRANSRPYIVALSPCTHPLGQDVELGFDVIRIPFIESVREVPCEEEVDDFNISEAHKTAMKHIIKNLEFQYQPDMFENPKIQSLYRAVEAIALNDDDVEPFVDTTKPRIEKFEGIEGDLFEELFGPFSVVSLKRTWTSASSSTKSKQVKVDYEIDEELLQNRVDKREVKKYTVDQLKQILRFKNETVALTGMKKNDLVDLIYKCCS